MYTERPLGVAIGSAANLGATTISRGHSDQGGSSISRWFDIAPLNNSGLNATMIFMYDGSELNGQDSSTLDLWKSTDGGHF